ncbi:HNH endonuclease [Streptomyces mexicanus]|uniref:HNH endonuclease n=1 Tax=Streptomyces mexicanus TaxID=178566 RepID=UPI00365F26EB
MRSLAVFAAAGAALATLISPAHAAGPGTSSTLPVRSLLEVLPVKNETRTGYERNALRHWIDANRGRLLHPQRGPPRGGCQRARTLRPLHPDRRYLVQPPTTTPTSTAPAAWTSTASSPLAEAWDSGAGTWTAAERAAYANDLDDPRALIAVTARSNRSKADQDPATWQPPADTYRCRYFTDWVAIKTRRKLAIDPAEQTALNQLAQTCPNEPVAFTPAR